MQFASSVDIDDVHVNGAAIGLGSNSKCKLNRDNPVRPTTQRGQSMNMVSCLYLWLINVNVLVRFESAYTYTSDADAV